MALTARRLEEMLTQAKNEILAGGRFHAPDCLARLCGKAPDRLKPALQQAEAKREIFSIEYQGQALYPDYAFMENEEGNFQRGLAEVITVLHPTHDGWGMAFWFRSPNNFLGGQRPEDILPEAPEAVLSAACKEVDDIMPG
ncbi:MULTISPECIES: hypothetical protein [Pseudomonadaceae]|uniref:Antitoxin Xre/MbcA/ParS-like toxin-binding domain-containing protein n=2 Tax=Pseudomonas TaxID=286 RepID=A0A0B1Z1G8_9PSED|nr:MULTISPECIES: hypothetical protein [Pseudomonadaceae]SBW85226.1 hypothetical protein PVE_P0186 [Pseudomonas veronii 1YdBTEX2]KHK64475.1 hypothetical protein JZ00_11960 [Pseudomonas frederiksbergensis]WRU63818.1 hypothetical protein VPH48_05200 [Pseudomonas veronii]WRU66151.1 hypothetical protein VPH48_33410 [Pseudomonas veronii]WRU66267.1 hypothetical protein VPH48_34745 [Pseudomonas veronii]